MLERLSNLCHPRLATRPALLIGLVVAGSAAGAGCTTMGYPGAPLASGYGPAGGLQPAGGDRSTSAPTVVAGATQVWRLRDETTVVEVDITPVGSGRYQGKVGVSAPGCGGGVEGPVARRGDVYTLINNDRVSGTVCRVTMTVRGRLMTVAESDCGNWHGPSCAFAADAPLTRMR